VNEPNGKQDSARKTIRRDEIVGKGNTACPVCKRSEGVIEEHISQSIASYHCPACGKYEMPPFVPEVHAAPEPIHKLSAWIREQNERGERVQFLREGMIENILVSIPNYRPSEKSLKLLKAIERKSGRLGNEVTLNLDEDIPLAYADDADELAFYLQSLSDRELVHIKPKPNAELIDHLFGRQRSLTITPSGWDHLDKHASDLQEKTQGFVAMSFSDKMKPLWKDAIQPAIEKAGYTAYRVDEELHSDNIIFKIMAEIKNSRFVVADITEQKNGVYFEAGYALGLGLPVIWCVREDDVDNVHFDTAQYNQIRWDSAGQLRESLYDFICAIIGKRSRSQV
jgi:nucleoside 2-deoxyribosyltransferase/transcription elongation factor Elf1